MSAAEQDPRPRLHALDAVRAVALLLGIWLHASLGFVPGLTLEVWPVSDPQKSTFLTLGVFLIHIFRMSAFFLIAGFLARVLFHRRGLRGFVRNRLARIALPLLLGWVVCLLLIGAVVAWVLARANGGVLPAQGMDTLPSPGLMHLWFLQLLLWLYAITLAVRGLLKRVDPNDRLAGALGQGLRWAVSSGLGTVVLALPLAGALLFVTEARLGDGVPTPGHTLVPPGVPLFVYFYVFAIGWLLDRQRHLLDTLARRWRVNFAWGLAATLVCLYLLSPEASRAALRHEVYSAAYALALACWTLSFVGAGLRFLGGESPVVRYLSDASYWMYVMHLPLVVALQAALAPSALHWSFKFALINVLTCAILLASYHLFVRSTWVGLLLNGRKVERRAVARTLPSNAAP
jgi:glucans biosynthesis protein C